MALIEEKSQQICVEGTPADSRQMREQVAALRDKADALGEACRRQAEDLRHVMRERAALDADIDEQLADLCGKEKALEDRASFGLSPESVEKQLDVYYDERHRLFGQLQAVREQMAEYQGRYDQLQEEVPAAAQARALAFEKLHDGVLVST